MSNSTPTIVPSLAGNSISERTKQITDIHASLETDMISTNSIFFLINGFSRTRKKS